MNLLNLNFSDFSETARVWLYLADKRMTKDEAMELADSAEEFADNWQSHRKGVKATSLFIEDQVLVFLVEDSDTSIGGCSIDSSVNFVKELGSKYNVDFFNRMLCAYIGEEGLKVIPTNQINDSVDNGDLENETLVLNTIIKSRIELENDLFISLESSWYKRFVKKELC